MQGMSTEVLTQIEVSRNMISEVFCVSILMCHNVKVALMLRLQSCINIFHKWFPLVLILEKMDLLGKVTPMKDNIYIKTLFKCID